MDTSTFDSGRDTKSNLRPPAKYHLTELTASEHNSRQTSMPPPPGIPTLKHRPQNLPEPQPKQRKTLAESAGEYPRKQYAPQASFSSSIRPVYPATKSSIPPPRSTLSASTNRPPTSYPPKTSTNGVSRQGHQRSQSAMGQNPRSQLQSIARPGTSHGSRPLPSIAQANPPKPAAPSGTEPISLSTNVFALPRRKTRARVVSGQSNITSRSSSSCSGTTLVPSVGGLSRSNSVAMVNRTNGRVSSLNLKFELLDLREDTPELEEDQSLSQSETNGAAQLKTPRHPQSSLIPVSTPKKNLETSLVKFQPPPTLPKPHSHSSPQKSPSRQIFLSKDANLTAPIAWETEGAIGKRLESMQNIFESMKSQMEGTTFESKGMKEIIEMLKTRVVDLEAERNRLTLQLDNYREKLNEAKEETKTANFAAEQERRDYEINLDDLERKHRHDLESASIQHEKATHQLEREAAAALEEIQREARKEVDILLREHNNALQELQNRLGGQLEKEKSLREQEVAKVTAQREVELKAVSMDIGQKEREAAKIREELDRKAAEVERERALRESVESKLAEIHGNTMALESANGAMKAKIDFLSSSNEAQSQQFQDLHAKMQEAIQAAAVANEKLRAEETLRRKLHNQVQELKGNIRVFCRVRPVIGDDEQTPAAITFPDQDDESKEIVVKGHETKSAMGNVTQSNNAFSFDRVFDPTSANAAIFEEISQLVQSALDGYNVCIFCYGQTGSGKTHTMSSPDGMIPRAVGQIYETAKALEEKGWKYKMSGSFVEIYNETINDLLGKAEDLDKKKHQILHDNNNKTTVTDTETVDLDSPERVHEVLKRADKNRTVAATKANSRSSRSHSVFILSLIGENSITGEKSEGTLNLVDLAGSERLSHSQAEGDRLKETQNINKSLSCLGDVIAALGKPMPKEALKDPSRKTHIPYRNSKLTYLLQHSLGGNSKTLMFVMVSPLQEHLNETLTSLKFATMVHNTHIGTAKQKKSH